MKTRFSLGVAIAAVVAVLCVSAGCATLKAGFHDTTWAEALRTWVGSNINDAIVRIGPPSNSYTLPNGDSIYTWMEVDGRVVHYDRWSGNANVYDKYCKKMLFAHPNGIIYDSRAEGNVHACQ